MAAVIMAGGLGSRLRPLTDDTPKPMLPIGGRPLLQRIIEQLKDAAIEQIHITTYYQPEKIHDYFGDGAAFGVRLTYSREDQPLGTAGALSMLKVSDEPLLVINGDVLTKINYRTMLHFHEYQRADLTMAVHKYAVQVPYGVVKSRGHEVCDLDEKPVIEFLINAGIYVLQPEVHGCIPAGRVINMSEFVTMMLQEGRVVVQYPFLDYWLDIGQPADYERAQSDISRFG